MILLSLLLNLLFAESVAFHEGKYVEALDLYTYRDGNVSYDANQTVVQYKDGKTITKSGDTLTVHNEKKELLTTIDLKTKPEIALYFSLTKALFLKDFKQLEENFEVKKIDKLAYLFKAKDDVKTVMNEISLSLAKDESVEFFVLKFTNGDKVKIEAK